MNANIKLEMQIETSKDWFKLMEMIDNVVEQMMTLIDKEEDSVTVDIFKKEVTIK